ncbi:MAG: hypothetical protein R3D88_07585 [Alphaproteobacteria bacterium]|nr:hypothetical protein [Alphaproteobacteria bacterium]
MSNPTKREFLGLLGGAAVLSAFAGSASAQTTDKSRISTFYAVITAQAYAETYGDKLTPAKISSAADLNAALSGTAEIYRENLVVAASDYFKGLDSDDAQALYKNITEAPFRKGDADRNLMSAFITDQEGYAKGRPTEINPLFAALHTLGQEKKITPDQSKDYIRAARDITHDYEPSKGVDAAINMKAFQTALVERIKPVVEVTPTAPATGAHAPSPFE